MIIKYINLNRNYKNTKLYKLKKILFITALYTLVGCSKEKDTICESDTNIIINSQSLEQNNLSNDVTSVVINESIVEIKTSKEKLDIIDNVSVETTINMLSSEVTDTVEEDKLTNLDSQEIEKKLVALTFDDGPSKYTLRLVEILKKNGATATFFTLGPRVKTYPETIIAAYESGNEIAIHGYSHDSFKSMELSEIQKEIDLTRELLNANNIECSNLVRPPGGNINNEIINSIDASFILWNVDPEDWKSRDVESIKKEIIGQIDDGDIILLHDIYETTVDAIEEILPELTGEYQFVTVSELFRLKEQELEENKKYYKVK